MLLANGHASECTGLDKHRPNHEPARWLQPEGKPSTKNPSRERSHFFSVREHVAHNTITMCKRFQVANIMAFKFKNRTCIDWYKSTSVSTVQQNLPLGLRYFCCCCGMTTHASNRIVVLDRAETNHFHLYSPRSTPRFYSRNHNKTSKTRQMGFHLIVGIGPVYQTTCNQLAFVSKWRGGQSRHTVGF